MSEISESTPFEFIVRGEPQGKGRPRVTRYVTYTPQKTKDYENLIKREFTRHLNASGAHKCMPFDGPLCVKIECVFERPKSAKRELHTVKPDWDNLGKTLDALNGLAWIDDSQIMDATVIKRYCLPGEKPFMGISILQIMSKHCNENKKKAS